MPTGHKKPPKQYGPPSAHVQVIDAIMNLGGDLQDAGHRIGGYAGMFPATKGSLLEELEFVQGLCEKWIEMLKETP